MHRITAIVMMALFFSPVVFANNESDKLLDKHEKCGELSSYSRIEGCFSQVYSESDRYLNKEYNELVGYLDKLKNKTHKKRLMSAQSAWIKFRDLDCGFYSDSQPIRFTKCLSERTIQRLKELEDFNVPYAMGCNGCPW
ncbi:MAG: lysozyme inhibitor LprI family protein [Methylovulum sp.]|uniref:lysozyme inhibitor LprI family protein n=1 Tax=Methylovulum sp. TaxID=1916980 RepID=UPI002608C520|nr:lysozyme inhibitor LprI family protein [Methylovulum sp.]MDD2722410.1 lysozyme inhibitor LprI family protein [Methylovulum sp.]